MTESMTLGGGGTPHAVQTWREGGEAEREQLERREQRREGGKGWGECQEGNKQSGHSSQQPVWGTELLLLHLLQLIAATRAQLLYICLGSTWLLEFSGRLVVGDLRSANTACAHVKQAEWDTCSNFLGGWNSRRSCWALFSLCDFFFLQKEQHAYLTAILHQQVGECIPLFVCMCVGSGCVLLLASVAPYHMLITDKVWDVCVCGVQCGKDAICFC